MPPKQKKIVSPTWKALKEFDEVMGNMTTAPPKLSPSGIERSLRTIQKMKSEREALASTVMGGSDRPRGTLPVPQIRMTPLKLPSATKKPEPKTWAEPSTRRVYTKKSEDDLKVEEFKKGGMVKKTGIVRVHKGEYVIPANRVSSVDKALKKAGLKPLKK